MKKKSLLNNYHDEGSWAISYGDMITILLCFFVLFFSFDFKEEEKNKLKSSLLEGLNLGQKVPIKSTSHIAKSSSNSDFFSKNKVIIERNGKVFIYFKNTSFFDSGRIDVNLKGKGILKKFVKKYLPFSGHYKVKVHAFTDSRPVKYKKLYRDNTELSALRSISVMRLFVKMGVPLKQIEINAKGKLTKVAQTLFGIDKIGIKDRDKFLRTIALVLYKEEAI